MSTRPKRLADARFGIARRLRGTWGFLRQAGGRDVFVHRSAILEGGVSAGDVALFVTEPAHPHARALLVVQLPSEAPLAALLRELDALRVRPMKPLNLKRWGSGAG